MINISDIMYSSDFVPDTTITTRSSKLFKRKTYLNETNRYAIYSEETDIEKLIDDTSEIKRLLIAHLKRSSFFRKWFSYIEIYLVLKTEDKELKNLSYKISKIIYPPSAHGFNLILNIFMPSNRVNTTYAFFISNKEIKEKNAYLLIKPPIARQISKNLSIYFH